MSQAFVATSSPNGWQLGQWTQKSESQWEESKVNDPNTVFKFEVVRGQSADIVPLRMVDKSGKPTGTEAIISQVSVQIFVDGQYVGAYGGEWRLGSKKAGAPPPVQTKGLSGGQPAAAAAPAAASRAPESTSKPAAAAAQQPAGAPANPYPQASSKPSAIGCGPTIVPPSAPVARSRKAADLDTSPETAEKLVQASRSGDAEGVKRLLAASADPDGKARDGTTPLLAAAGQGHLPVVQALIDAGADANIGKDGNNPMTVAFQKGHQDILKALFSAAFQSLETAVGPGAVFSPSGSIKAAACGDDEISTAAISELKEVTAKLAALGTSQPIRGGGFGGGGDDVEGSAQGDMDKMREEAVKDAMKLISASNK